MTDFVLSARDNKLPVISKVGQLNRCAVARLLEARVVGIQLPRTELRENLLELIDYMKFIPVGTQPGNYDRPRVRRPMEDMLALCFKHKVPFGTTPSGPKAAAPGSRKRAGFPNWKAS